MTAESKRKPDPKGRGDFFKVDRLAWASAARLGSMNAMVAYLVLARGASGLRTTAWSANAIESHTGMHWRDGKAAIDKLDKAGLVRRTDEPKPRGRPRYFLSEVAGERDPANQWTFLPNSLVDGVAGIGLSPVELLRQSGDAAALKLLVELYDVQRLGQYGGVHWGLYRRRFDREQIGARGRFVIWGFVKGEEDVSLNLIQTVPVPESFWQALETLRMTGLIEEVGHVLNSSSDEAVIIHPFALDGTGEEGERAVASAAHNAGLALLDTAGRKRAIGMLLVPQPNHVRDVQLVGLLRLRYRARTGETASWLAKAAEWARAADVYEQARGSAGQTRDSRETAAGSGDIKEDQGASRFKPRTWAGAGHSRTPSAVPMIPPLSPIAVPFLESPLNRRPPRCEKTVLALLRSRGSFGAAQRSFLQE